MAVVERTYTADDLLMLSHAPDYADKRLELSDGELIIKPFAFARHGVITATIGQYIGKHADSLRLGYVTAAGTGHVVCRNPDTIRAPDVGFVAADRLPEGLPDGYVPFAPDLAVEVMSPHDSADEIQKKVLEYLRYGTRLIWVVYPETRTVTVYTADGARIVDENGTLDGGDVLPGFTLPVSRVFA